MGAIGIAATGCWTGTTGTGALKPWLAIGCCCGGGACWAWPGIESGLETVAACWRACCWAMNWGCGALWNNVLVWS